MFSEIPIVVGSCPVFQWHSAHYFAGLPCFGSERCAFFFSSHTRRAGTDSHHSLRLDRCLERSMFITIVSLRRELILPSYQMLLAPAGKNQKIVGTPVLMTAFLLLLSPSRNFVRPLFLSPH
jgi:hypothetical protein